MTGLVAVLVIFSAGMALPTQIAQAKDKVQLVIVERKGEEVKVEVGFTGSSIASCNSDEFVTGGGFESAGVDAVSGRFVRNHADGNAWKVTLRNIEIGGEVDQFLTAYAECAHLELGTGTSDTGSSFNELK